MTHHALFASHALLPEGWRENVLLRWNAEGNLLAVDADRKRPAETEQARGPVIPGMPNIHCHAFQRAMAGLAEFRGDSNDSFWTWRELMYKFAARITPEAQYAVARHLYVEMLKAGYTSVCEFHYVHHGPGGVPYDDPAEMAAHIVAAARDTGIGLTFLPVLYQYSGFGERTLRPEQQRFGTHPDWVLDLVARLMKAGVRCGIAPHSLRAVSPDSLRALLDGACGIDPSMPVHIHIAEQTAEVEDCIAHTGARPVDWLLDHFDVDYLWCLVHATHMTASECLRVAESEAAVGLCPTTEANLGDGIFDAEPYCVAGGQWGIGSDSNISVSVAEELRLLEYAQRLRRRSRNVLASAETSEVGQALYIAAVEGGAAPSGRPLGGLNAGQRADFLVLDESHSSLAMRPPTQLLSGLVFANHGATPIRDVYVGGRRVVSEQHHAAEQASSEAYRQALEILIR
jgi:formimidoylglutamate deiminase